MEKYTNQQLLTIMNTLYNLFLITEDMKYSADFEAAQGELIGNRGITPGFMIAADEQGNHFFSSSI